MIPITVDKIKAYRLEHPGADLKTAVRAVRKMHIHTPRMDTMRLTVCKRGHGATHQRYCSECGAKFCTECQQEQARKAQREVTK